MVDSLNPMQGEALQVGQFANPKKILPQEIVVRKPMDTVNFGDGKSVGKKEAMGIVLERAYDKLRGVVGDARAALGIPEGAEIDTSPDATANRIADFALGFFGKYAENNGLENNEEGRAQFAEFIGAAISQGIEEARGILDSLSALNGEVNTDIDSTASIIQDRLNDFVKNGMAG